MFYRQIEYQHEMDEVGKSKNFKYYSQTFWVSFLLNASGQFPSNGTISKLCVEVYLKLI